MNVKWGVIGLGKIAEIFINDLIKVKGGELFAVASRTQSKADDFAEKFQVKHAYGSYIELLENPEVDVVYIATPHVFHHENTLEVLKHKKAVLCEKPLAMNTKQVKEMQALAKQNKVFFMEALWTDFMPGLQLLKDIQKNNTYGNIRNLKAEFCFEPEFNENSRLFNKKLGGGALLDIGIYPVYLALRLMGKPDKIEAHAQFNQTDVDVETNIRFWYNNAASADLFCSLKETTKSEALIEFEKAEITIHERFHESDKLSIKTENEVIKKDFDHQYRGYNFEIEHVQECLQKGLTESPFMTFAFSLSLMETLDEIRNQIGLNYFT
jgi:predicted dehydrogenase